MKDQICHGDRCSERAWIFDAKGAWCDTHYDARTAARRDEERDATLAAGGPWPQTCPRRMSGLGPWEYEQNLDTWDIREQMANGLRARHCSFCGSLHPDDLIRLVGEGYRVSFTDKSYKVYVDSPTERQVSKFYLQHLSEEQLHQLVAVLDVQSGDTSGGVQ